MGSDDDPLIVLSTTLLSAKGCSLPGNGMGKNFCPGNFFWCKTFCTDPNCIFCIRLLLHRFHAVFQWRSCQLQHGRFSGGIRTDFFDHIIRDSCVRDPHCSIFHRTVTGTVQHRHLQLSLIRHILLHGNIRMIFHKQRLLFVPESTLVLC